MYVYKIKLAKNSSKCQCSENPPYSYPVNLAKSLSWKSYLAQINPQSVIFFINDMARFLWPIDGINRVVTACEYKENLIEQKMA